MMESSGQDKEAETTAMLAQKNLQDHQENLSDLFLMLKKMNIFFILPKKFLHQKLTKKKQREKQVKDKIMSL